MERLRGQIIFVTGGARSGKSSFAEQYAAKLALSTKGAVVYLATAQAFDDEMSARITRHQDQRPSNWDTIEEPLAIVDAIQSINAPILLLDCLSLWVSNLVLADWTDEDILKATDQLLQTLAARGGHSLLVSNEVGFGIVPDNALARRYRDTLGWVNQKAAAASAEAYLLVSGLTLTLKGIYTP